MNEMQKEKLVHALSLGLKQDWSLSTKIRYSHLLTIGVEMGLIEETADMMLELLEMCKTEEKANSKMDEIGKELGIKE